MASDCRRINPFSRNKFIAMAFFVTVATLTGCASSGSRSGGSPADLAATDESVHIDLIRKMLHQQKYYAALAHIQQQQRVRLAEPTSELNSLMRIHYAVLCS